jgi:uncharacterized protein YndB with AHSA1/START domain
MAQATEASWQPEPLRISRTYPVRPELLFKAWTTAEHVAQFFAPAPYTVPGATIDLRVGGTYDVGMRSPAGDEHWSRGTITELVGNRRLVIDFDTVDEDGNRLFRALTALDFVAVPEGTRLDVVQFYTVFDERARPMIGGSAIGWNMTLDQLGPLVVSLA